MKNMTPADFLKLYRREHETTRRVLVAFPPERADFKPHERSSDAKKLAFTFVAEEKMMLMALRNQPILGSGFPQPAETWDETLQEFHQQHHEIERELERLGDSTPEHSVTFYTGPGMTGEYSLMEFLWFMLLDQVHHRGQLSVYVRMTGGRVPSIYGPSADEPWN